MNVWLVGCRRDGDGARASGVVQGGGGGQDHSRPRKRCARAPPQSGSDVDASGRSHFGYVLYVHGSVGEEEKDSDEETSESMTATEF